MHYQVGVPSGPTCFFPRRSESEAWDLEAVAAHLVRFLLVPSRDEGAAEVGGHSPVSVEIQELEGEGMLQKSLSWSCLTGAVSSQGTGQGEEEGLQLRSYHLAQGRPQ